MVAFGTLLLIAFIGFIITSWSVFALIEAPLIYDRKNIYRIVPWLLAWLLKLKFNLNVSIGRIGLGWPYLILKEVHITRNGFSIVRFVTAYIGILFISFELLKPQQIEEVALRSSFLSSEVSKLLLVIIKDVRIKKDIGRQQDGEPTAAASTTAPISVKDLRVPPVLISLTQVRQLFYSSWFKIYLQHY